MKDLLYNFVGMGYKLELRKNQKKEDFDQDKEFEGIPYVKSNLENVKKINGFIGMRGK